MLTIKSLIKKEYEGSIQHLIYLITTSFGLNLRETRGFEGAELCNSFKLYPFSFFNDFKKMQNLIRIASKWQFFSEGTAKLPSS